MKGCRPYFVLVDAKGTAWKASKHRPPPKIEGDRILEVFAPDGAGALAEAEQVAKKRIKAETW